MLDPRMPGSAAVSEVTGEDREEARGPLRLGCAVFRDEPGSL